MKNDVIIIGGDHSNTLGVIRMFGENQIQPYVYIIDDDNRATVIKSKYVKEAKIFYTEEETINYILDKFKNNKLKPILIPTTDKTSSEIDKRYDEISKYFITQSINKKANTITKFMDKYEQYKFSQNFDIKMAKSVVLLYPFDITDINKDFNYPLILKPLLSIDGKKMDIRIVNSKDDLINALNIMKNDYKRILVQEYIMYDYECDMSGFCYDNNVSISGYVKKERIWPQKKGSMTFGIVSKCDDFSKEIDEIKKIIISLNYEGLFDIEFFVKDKTVYLNEINFRNSGLTYLYGNSYICYYYYKSLVERKFIPAPVIENEYNVMDDHAEIHQILEKNITFKQHCKDRKKTKIFLAKNSKDNYASLLLFLRKIISKFDDYNIIKKIIHVTKPVYLYKLECKKKEIHNKNYEFVKVTSENYKDICFGNSADQKYFKRIVKNKNYYCVALKIDGSIVGRGVIAFNNSNDYYTKIKSDSSILFSSLYIDVNYRGHNYQNVLFEKMVDISFNIYKNPVIYVVVSPKNLPSRKNIEKFGFIYVDSIKVIRALGKSFNKKII